ncbi:amino acid adenylation domain-containing protein [Lentzea atacamensis]|uniref:Phenyloxazoline synthase MbtB n=1 Tax=Lentzea atacamensis TaxID=531938 RepID=A0ABX9EKK4_9PSEU|nr:AMP-binding protein [Lentzea atacamensis]RAS71104.1 amino acid adenylation domain-containing protein [Lentzea atacamensis]
MHNDLPARIADLLGLDDVGADDNLIELGMDSITMMRLAGAWRKEGVGVKFADLVANPTLRAWQSLLGATTQNDVRRVDIDETAPFPLALMQHAYWVGRAPGQQLGGVAAHFYHEFDGTGVDPERLERAVRAVIARHGMLRVRVLDDGTQVIVDDRWPGLTVHTQSDVDELRRTLSHRNMDIANGEVFDVQLSLLGDGRTRVHVNLDMIAADALSLRGLLGDLARAYQGAELRPLDYSFPRYLAERSHTAGEQDVEYWRQRLAELPGAPELPVTGADTAVVLRRHRWLAPDEVRALETNAARHGLTPAMALAAVFAETLTAWSAEPRFLLNLPLFDREPLHADVDELVGDFTSSILLAWEGGLPGTFAERALRLQEQFHADVAHSAYSGVEVLRDLSRLHGERVLAPVVYTSALGLGELFSDEVKGCFGEASWIISQGPQVWLDAQVTELNGGLLVNWDIREDAFTPGVPDAMFNAYAGLLDWLLVTPDAWTTPVPALLPVEQQEIRFQVNDTAVRREPRGLHDPFFAQAAKTPHAPALLSDEVVSYGELADRARRIAGQLRQQGVQPGDLVAIDLPKGPEQVVAVLGVLAAGAAYLPLGTQPQARKDRILATAGVAHVLGELVFGDPIDPVPGGDLAYVLYTSGSTGEPKGVEITHSAAVNTIDDLNERFAIGPDDRTLALSALEFDLSVYDMFGPLAVGGAVVCVRDTGRRDATKWVELLVRHRATVLNCVPALLDMVLTVAEEDLPLRLVLLGGDWVTTDLPGRLWERAAGCRFVGLGGTTETAIHSTVCEVVTVDPQWTSVPYGTPLGNVRCRVADALGRDCPDHVPGELWIGGAGVARGYRGDPERTAAKFVDGWYRTGDRARYWPDGTLEFLGRADHQVKIRGHRVELGEIEAALTSHPAVRSGVVVVTQEGKLAAAITGNAEDVLDFLRDRLPPAMVPDTVTVLPSLPLTANGKIDRKRLAAELRGSAQLRVTPPATETERQVAAAWSALLNVQEVGREHDFFTLGGDSLLATRLIVRLREAGLDGMSLSALFANPVLKDFAATLVTGGTTAPWQLEAAPEQRHEPFPPTDVQRAYWLGRDESFTLGGVGCHFYREYEVADLDVERLENAVNALIARHEMLRAVFDENGDQRILESVPKFEVQRGFDRETQSRTVFDPEQWPLFSVAVDGNRVAIGIDNLILDALSILIFYAELGTLYDCPDTVLPPIGVSFRDYVLSLPEPSSQDYWDALELPPAPKLPLAKDPADVTPVFSRRTAHVDSGRWKSVVERAREHGLTPSAVLMAAFAEVLGRWSGRGDLTLNVTLFDRAEVHPDITSVMGDFTSLLLVACGEGETWLDRAKFAHERLWQAIDHRDVSAVRVMRSLPEGMPVVFTSALGVGVEQPSTLFDQQVWGVSQTPQVWLDHQVTESAGGVELNWDAVDELFPDGVLDDMFAAYLSLVDHLATGDWAEIPDLLPAAQRQVREQVNATDGPVPDRTLHADFFRHAAETPDRVAIVWEGGRLTYGELADRALRTAAVIGPGEEPVAVSLPKGPDQIAAVLGVLAAGRAYVPIGVDQPPARRERMLRGISQVVTRLDLAAHPAEVVHADPDSLAYVIFTSGSTGEPKGVEITHRAALNTIDDINEKFAVTADDRVLAVSALDFDLSVYDIFGLLGAGGTVVTITEDERRDAERWHELVERFGVTVWNTVPALAEMLSIVGDTKLRLVLVSGDWVGLDLPERFPEARFVAMGGATEASIWSNYVELRRPEPGWRSIPYGTPLRNQRFRVVDSAGRDCPDRVAGELWIGGAGVARGYRDDPARTAEKFTGGWYRTGDLGRYWPDGTLEFLGRADQQVKIRGHRVELGEVEAALLASPGVTQAVAAVSQGRLVAAVTGSEVDAAIVAERLPAHMIPDHVELLDEIPLSANGKVDRQAVAALVTPRTESAAPQGELETEIAALWADLLGLDEIGRTQNFFTLGGDSLKATRFVEVLRGKHGPIVSLRSFFAAPTVAAVAEALDADVEEGVL